MDLEAAASDRVKALLGGTLAQAEVLVRSFILAVTEQALSNTIGGSPPPSSITTQRASVLLYLSKNLQRIPSGREVSVLFRISASQSNACRRELVAQYETELSSFLLGSATADATWTFVKSDSDRMVRKVILSSSLMADQVEAVLRRDVLWDGCIKTGKEIVFPEFFDFPSAKLKPEP